MTSIETILQSQAEGMRHSVPFLKMHGLGNDFVVVHERDLEAVQSAHGNDSPLESYAARLAANICRRNFGIGADGLIVVRDANREDCQVRWLYLNSDGSESAMCGNGLRCLALYAVHHGITSAPQFKVETALGSAPIYFESGEQITTDLGEPILTAEGIPISDKLFSQEPAAGCASSIESTAASTASKRALALSSRYYQVTCIGMGNPHCVIFLDQPEDEGLLLNHAHEIQQHPAFPAGVNVEFVQCQKPDAASVFVVERGCGPTLACATGAAAVLVAGVLRKRLNRSATITLPGGSLRVTWSEQDNHVRITGPAAIAFQGLFDLSLFLSEVASLPA